MAIDTPKAPVLIITDGKSGDQAPCLALSEALHWQAICHQISPFAPYSVLAPWGPASPQDTSNLRRHIDALLAEATQPIRIIATGRRAVPSARWLKKIYGDQVFLVFLRNPRTSLAFADAVWAPSHDQLTGPCVFSTPLGPHRFSQNCLTDERKRDTFHLATLGPPRIAVLVGGQARRHRFTSADRVRFLEALQKLAATPASLMITTSRRTPAVLVERLQDHFGQSTQHRLWTGEGDNPLAAFLAWADGVVATTDSINMVGEAAATGRALSLFHPSGGHPKFDRFLQELEKRAVLHNFTGQLAVDPYPPVDDTSLIADFVESRLQAHVHKLATR